MDNTQHVSDTSLWYFAYGANMSAEVLTRRGLAPRHSEPAWLEDHARRFSHRGLIFTEPAFANIEPEAGERVHGILHRIRDQELGCLDRIEGAEYAHIEVTVQRVVGAPVQARAYRDPYPARGLLPSRRYLRCLCIGATEGGLPEAEIATLAAHPARYVPLLSELTTLLVGTGERLRRAGLRPELWRMRRRGQIPRRSR